MPVTRPRPTARPQDHGPRRPKLINRLLEHSLIREVSFERYRRKVRDVYDGPQGAILAACSALSLHAPLGERLFQPGRFDLRGARRILDVGSGAGQLVRHLLKLADVNAGVTCVDLSPGMLRRARARLQSPRLQFLAADLTQLPFADESFDCVTCGYVLEHLPDASLGLHELGRVMERGARMLLLTTEDNMAGAWTSRMWCCRTYNREMLYGLCKEAGLRLQQELWFSRVHKALRAGGICVELVKD